MPVALIPSFLFYCLVAGITPGPANLCSLNAALRFGKKKAFRQWKGLFAGFWIVSLSSVMIVYFFGTVFHQYVKYLSIIGAIYILWLAFHVFTSKSGVECQDDEENVACNFKTGFYLQVSNVKVIIFCISALSSYVLPFTESFLVLLLVGAFLPFTGPMANLIWLGMGLKLQKLFQKHEKIMNLIMAGSLVFCAFSIVFL